MIGLRFIIKWYLVNHAPGCYFGDVEGLACKTEGWCIPESYGCNGVVNCPSMEDETLHNCEGIVMLHINKIKNIIAQFWEIFIFTSKRPCRRITDVQDNNNYPFSSFFSAKHSTRDCYMTLTKKKHDHIEWNRYSISICVNIFFCYTYFCFRTQTS